MAEHSASVVGRRALAPGVWLIELTLAAGDALTFAPGQFISVRCGASGDLRRSYTLVSAPAQLPRLELLVKDVDGGVGTDFIAKLAVGDALSFTGPMGFFVPDATHTGDIVHLVTGAGIAAARPIILASTQPTRLIWGQLDGQPRYWEAELDALAVRRHSFSWTLVTAADWPAVHTLLAERAVALLPQLVTPLFFTVGNGDMCRRVREALVTAGVDRRKQIRNEVFYPVMEGTK